MTHKEIARQLGISPAALSLIVNGKPGVSVETRQRILQQLEQMGYAHLIKKTPGTVEPVSSVLEKNLCFVLYKQSGRIINQNPFVMLLMEHIENRAKQFGYQLLVTTIDSTLPLSPQFARLNHTGAHGILIMATEMRDEDEQYLSELTLPYVAMDNDFTNYYINTVSINNQMGTYQAVQYLVSMGHTQIGYLKSKDWISSWGERDYGFHRALAHFGLQLPEKYIFHVRYNEEASYQDFKKYLADGVALPSALVTDDDVIAIGVIRALTEAGYSVPDDVSIVGFNNRPCCTIMTPQLTSIDVPKYAFSAKAVDMLLRLISDSLAQPSYEDCIKERISTQLIVRQSVKNLQA